MGSLVFLQVSMGVVFTKVLPNRLEGRYTTLPPLSKWRVEREENVAYEKRIEKINGWLIESEFTDSKDDASVSVRYKLTAIFEYDPSPKDIVKVFEREYGIMTAIASQYILDGGCTKKPLAIFRCHMVRVKGIVTSDKNSEEEMGC